VIRRGIATETVVQSDPTYVRPSDAQSVTLPVTWGVWNQGVGDIVLDYFDPDDPRIANALAAEAYWMTVLPTAPGNLPLSGTIDYDQPIAIHGNADGNALTGLSGLATVDFGGGSVNGSISFSGGGTWNVDFAGSANGPDLNLSVQNTSNRNGAQQVTGGMRGFLTGPKGEAIASSFQLNTTDNANHAVGNFLLGCGSTQCP
jgi:hypothetical protein